MQLKSFLETFTPSAHRSDVDQVVELLATQVASSVDIWGRYADDINKGNVIFKSEFVRDFESAYRKRIRLGSRTWASSIAANFVTAQQTLVTLKEKYLDKSIGAVARSVPLQTATVYHVLALLGMAAEYGNCLLLAATTLEVGGRGNTVTPVDARYLERYRNSFLQVMELLDANGKDIDKIIHALPDVDIDAETVDRVTSVTGISKIDPLRSNLISIPTNPFHYIGMKWAVWQADKHRKLKEEVRLLEYRLLQMQEANREQPDPKLEKAIEYYSDERKKLIAKIARLEE